VSYTAAVLLAVLGATVVDLGVLRTMLLCRKAFWTSYAILAFFQLIVNGLLTGLHVVRYDEALITGVRIGYAPVEDLFFGFAMVLVTLSLWVWWGRRAARRARRPDVPARKPAAR
jgi:lycopene cyclase domain-containing protein